MEKLYFCLIFGVLVVSGCNTTQSQSASMAMELSLDSEEENVSREVRSFLKKLEGGALIVRKSTAFDGWTMPHPREMEISRAHLLNQCSVIIPYGRSAAPELLRWLDHKEMFMRFIAAHSLKEITGLDPSFYYFGTPYKPFDGHDRGWFERARQTWADWYGK